MGAIKGRNMDASPHYEGGFSVNRVEMIAALKLSEDKIRSVRQDLEEVEMHEQFTRLRAVGVLAGLRHGEEPL